MFYIKHEDYIIKILRLLRDLRIYWQSVSGRMGRVMVKVEPQPTSLTTWSLPPCASTILRLAASPNPVPRTDLVKSGEKIFSRFSVSIPFPVSAMLICEHNSSCLALILRSPPCG